MELEAYFYCI